MDNKERFLSLLKSVKREGVENLLNWLESTDFFKAPASTMYHGNYEGGLLDHSLHVHDTLFEIVSKFNLGYNYESIVLTSLLHDLCKINYYVQDFRNVKDETTGRWERKPFFKRKEQYAFGGHGSKSVYLIMKWIGLTEEEAAAINAHMGAWDKSEYGNPGEVYEQNMLAWLLHVADEYATYKIDRRVK